MFWFRNEEELYEEGRPIEEQYLERILPVKLDIALEYSRRRTFYSDMEIIFRTVLGLQAPFATRTTRENRSAARAFLSVLRAAHRRAAEINSIHRNDELDKMLHLP